uniref:Uncharacterized protein n=1 Tax=Panagrolaimus davidi TaxID=227884 RepID=A0A914P6E6_9BILA
MKEFDFGVFFENVLLNRKFDYLKVYGYISAEYLFKISSQLLKFKSVQLKNLNPAFPILNLKILQKFYASILQSPKHECSKFEIVQIDPNENVINVLALENERYILHSYFQPKSDTPFLFYE